MLLPAALLLAAGMGFMVSRLAARPRRRSRQRWRGRRRRIDRVRPAPGPGFPRRKPEWVRRTILAMHARTGLSHRKLADAFNLAYFATTGESLGRTWVRDQLIKQAHEALHRQRALKHRLPDPLPVNAVWGIDTTCVRDAQGVQNTVLGIVDHGARLSVALRPLRRFNTWTLLGCLLLAFGEFGRPAAIKTDNHPVFHAKWVQRMLHWCSVVQRFSAPGKPWQNGRIERFFGTLKACLCDFVVRDDRHLWQVLSEFRIWYNEARPHQHLAGCTPGQVWAGVDPYRRPAKAVEAFCAWDGRLRGWVLRH